MAASASALAPLPVLRAAREPGLPALLEVSRIAGQSVVTRQLAGNPLKLLSTRSRGTAAWVYTTTFGGGLVEGDAIALDVQVHPGAALMLATQSATKVYPCPLGVGSSQSLKASVADGALLALLPDPLCCFEGSRYEQQLDISLEAGASLVLLDWFTAGRMARGERWAMDRYHSELRIHRAGRLLLLDPVTLDAADGEIAGSARMGRYNCFATLVLLGPRMQQLGQGMLQWSSTQRVRKQPEMLAVASPLREGVILRIASTSTESASTFLRQWLEPLASELGDDPWRRKW